MEQQQSDREYPCPLCLNTMVPGQKRSYSPGGLVRGTGKVWNLEDGLPRLEDCVRCSGQGLLENRRDRRERRNRPDRRLDGL